MKKLCWGNTTDKNLGPLLLRVFAGAAIMTHGVPKLFGGLEDFTAFVTSQNIPAAGFLAFMAAFTESIGALLLLLGLGTRVVSFLLICNMSVAAFFVHANDPFKTKELAFVYLFIALAYFLKGAGKWSLDSVISSALNRNDE